MSVGIVGTRPPSCRPDSASPRREECRVCVGALPAAAWPELSVSVQLETGSLAVPLPGGTSCQHTNEAVQLVPDKKAQQCTTAQQCSFQEHRGQGAGGQCVCVH